MSPTLIVLIILVIIFAVGAAACGIYEIIRRNS